MLDHGLCLSLQAIRRQLAAMPGACYLIRLIHHSTRKAFPGHRRWTAAQLSSQPIVRFLRARNRAGYDVYFRPSAAGQNAGYILVDLDHAAPTALEAMRANGHAPCTVIETSPGHLQAWVAVSAQPLAAAVATEIGRQLARLYQGDAASTDWSHLGRLAGFTNQKPQRRRPDGWPPWVKLRYAAGGLAAHGHDLVEAASRRVALARTPLTHADFHTDDPVPSTLTPPQAGAVYQTWMNRLRIPQRFPAPDWSIADLWIAKELLRRGAPAAEIRQLLRWASPQFPRRHTDPEDYLRRTLARAAADLAGEAFPARDDEPLTVLIAFPEPDS